SVSAFVNPAQNSVKNIQTDLATNYLDGLVKNMPGIKWDVGGYQRAVTLFLDILMKYYLFAILAMYLMMAVLFSSYSQPLLVLYAIPFGLLGSVTGHILLDLDLTLWSFVGMVAVSGVVVNDNLVLIDYINTQRAKGENVFVSVCEAGRVRFRPIMLTSLTTFVGLAPLISETSVQAQFLIPMAVSLAFGVVFATLISLLLVPATYLMMVEWQTTLLRLFKQTPKGSSEDPVEAAYQRGFEQGTRNARKAVCPYKDDVLSSSWEAGLNDARNL
ncbi:MAG: multidrug efflux pump subunit AcrB/ribosome modulation factor, partial [Arenicella sp.]